MPSKERLGEGIVGEEASPFVLWTIGSNLLRYEGRRMTPNWSFSSFIGPLTVSRFGAISRKALPVDIAGNPPLWTPRELVGPTTCLGGVIELPVPLWAWPEAPAGALPRLMPGPSPARNKPDIAPCAPRLMSTISTS